MVVQQEVREIVLQFVRDNPLLPTKCAQEILLSKFPTATGASIQAVMRETAAIRHDASKTANAVLHAAMVKYLQDHPDRYTTWLLYDFPEATICSINRAILAVYKTQAGNTEKRDMSCPESLRALKKNRLQKQLAAAKAKFMGSMPPATQQSLMPDVGL